MRILITNDDGINAPALKPLAEWAKKHGEVTVVAPKIEQSGKSHGIEIIKPMEIKKVDFLPGIDAYSVDSTPADCVRFGIIGLKRNYDLVISGINRGYNLGKDIVYSGTVGAIYEASGLGIKSIALSTAPNSLQNALSHLDEVFDFSERKKEEIKKDYEENLGVEFEREYKRGNLDHLTIIEISSETEITMEEV